MKTHRSHDPIGERTIQWIDKYLAETRPELACGRDEGRLFLNRLGEAISPNGLTALVRNYIEQANISKRGSYHLFRHTMATLMLENGADIRDTGPCKAGYHADLHASEYKKIKEIHTLTHPAKAKRTKVLNFEEEQEAAEEALFSALAPENDSED